MDRGGISDLAGWHIWRGVGGLWYARYPKSSPPLVVRARARKGLRAAAAAAVAARARLAA